MNRQFRRNQNKKEINTMQPQQMDELTVRKDQVRQIQQQYINSYTNVFNSVVLELLKKEKETNLWKNGKIEEDNLKLLMEGAIEISDSIRKNADEYAKTLASDTPIPVSLLQRIEELEKESESKIKVLHD